MPFINCFDTVSMVVEEATERIKPLKLQEDRLEILKEYCEAIDVLIQEHDATAIDAEIDENTHHVHIAMLVPEFVLKGKQSEFFRLIQCTDSFGFSVDEDGDLIVKFTFPSLWA
ncbi:MAG: hypothetical protein IKY16_06785 [Bacteroidales bacterium]|nr:hypothetical protein [Bacteroidales bacterium]